MSTFTIYQYGQCQSGVYGGYSTRIENGKKDNETTSSGSMKVNNDLELNIRSLIASLQTIQKYRSDRHKIKLFVNSPDIIRFFKTNKQISEYSTNKKHWLDLKKCSNHFEFILIDEFDKIEEHENDLIMKAYKMGKTLKKTHENYMKK